MGHLQSPGAIISGQRARTIATINASIAFFVYAVGIMSAESLFNRARAQYIEITQLTENEGKGRDVPDGLMHALRDVDRVIYAGYKCHTRDELNGFMSLVQIMDAFMSTSSAKDKWPIFKASVQSYVAAAWPIASNERAKNVEFVQ